MSRPDLLALTPQALASLTNLGLVKRAQRDAEAGSGPALREDADGTVVGTFPDGVVARLRPGVPLGDVPCTCGAPAACRHRVGVALAYRTWHGAAEPPPAWSPAALGDAELEAALGRRTLGRARALLRAGCEVEVRAAGPAGGAAAVLPTTSVQFLVPGDLAYARCGCALAERCEHVALAVWAFREAEALPAAGVRTVHLGAARVAGLEAPLQAAAALCAEVIADGVVNLSPALGTRLSRVRVAVETAGLVWPAGVLEELGEALAAHRARSARYRPHFVAVLLAELEARRRAAGAAGELPAAAVLGLGEARDTPLAQVRLIALGARVAADGPAREAEVFLADPEASAVMVLRRRWEPRAPETTALGARLAAAGVRLGDLATGDVVARGAHCLASRELKLASRRGSTSVTPLTESWLSLPASLRVTRLRALAEDMRGRPPRLLRPRVLAPALRVIAVAAVREVAYSPGQQALTALLADEEGAVIRLVKRHRAATPHALDALARLLAAATPPTHVSGEVKHGREGLELDPVGVLAGRLHVPDLAAGAPAPRVALGEARADESPLTAALREAWGVLEDLVHHGGRHASPAWHQRAAGAADALEAAGLARLAGLLREAAAATRALQAGEAEAGRLGEAWASAAIRLDLTAEGVQP